MRSKFKEPIDYIVSRLELKDSNENVAIGVIVMPRYEGDTDDRFCGTQGDLNIRIEGSRTRQSDAYELACSLLDNLKGKHRLLEYVPRLKAKVKVRV
jgi:hypothetical protein